MSLWNRLATRYRQGVRAAQQDPPVSEVSLASLQSEVDSLNARVDRIVRLVAGLQSRLEGDDSPAKPDTPRRDS